MSCPIGFKNGTDGSVQMAADALVACRSPHAFLGMTKMGQAAIFETTGNADCHIILRGGSRGPNYSPADIEAACAALRKAGVTERVMVDCSHANSAKKYERQIEVARELGEQIAGGERRIFGLMIESNLKPGRQELRPGVPLEPGVSITDGCIGWEQTEGVLRELAQAARRRVPPLLTRCYRTASGKDCSRHSRGDRPYSSRKLRLKCRGVVEAPRERDVGHAAVAQARVREVAPAGVQPHLPDQARQLHRLGAEHARHMVGRHLQRGGDGLDRQVGVAQVVLHIGLDARHVVGMQVRELAHIGAGQAAQPRRDDAGDRLGHAQRR